MLLLSSSKLSRDQENLNPHPDARQRVSLRLLLSLFLTLVVLVLLAGCGNNTVYEPVGYKKLNGKRALFLLPSPESNLDTELQKRMVDLTEQILAKSPNLAGLVTRDEFLGKAKSNLKLQRDYQLFSETMAVVGVSERTLSRVLGEAAGAEILIHAQPVFVPCEFCEDKNQFVLSGHVVDVESGEFLWRGQMRQSIGNPTPENLASVAEELKDDLVTALEESFSAKWHRLRFDQLSAAK